MSGKDYENLIFLIALFPLLPKYILSQCFRPYLCFILWKNTRFRIYVYVQILYWFLYLYFQITLFLLHSGTLINCKITLHFKWEYPQELPNVKDVVVLCTEHWPVSKEMWMLILCHQPRGHSNFVINHFISVKWRSLYTMLNVIGCHFRVKTWKKQNLCFRMVILLCGE